MSLPAVLLIDDDTARRRALAVGLARFAYEVVPASSAAEGVRFAAGLGPSVVVAPARLEGFGESTRLAVFTGGDADAQRTLVLLGTPPGGADTLPENVLYIDIEGRTVDEIVRRIRLVMVGREVGLAPDVGLKTLLGDLSMSPLLEVASNLHSAGVSGTLQVDTDGAIQLDQGEVTAARAGASRGVKAVCRLARRSSGSLRLSLGAPTSARNVDRDFHELMVEAIEDAQIPLPALGARVRLVDARAEQDTESDPMLRAAIGDGTTVGSLLDVLSLRDGQVAERIERLVARGVLALDRPRPRVAVVTDSTADLPVSLVDAFDLHVVPLKVRFGNDLFRDGVDIRPRDFYKLIASHAPSTEPPAVEEIAELYKHLAPERDVVSVHISGAMSETLAHARTAAERTQTLIRDKVRESCRIETIDSRGVSLGLGLLALFAARMAARGRDAETIAARLHAWRGRVATLFVVDTFDYLVRGGRVGRARAAFGRMLGIKPILGVDGGEVAAIDRVRGGRRAHPRIVELVAERVDGGRPIVLGVAHAAAPVWADRLRSLLAERFELAEVVLSDIGPVVGSHAGPGCVGCVVFQPTDDEWAEIAPL